MMLTRIVNRLERRKREKFEAWMRARSQSSKTAGADDVRWLLPIVKELVRSSGIEDDADLRHSAQELLLTQLPKEAWMLAPGLEKRAEPVRSTWTYQNEVMKWDIAETDLVLDVGSGGYPFQRANHLADKFPEETTHRVEPMVLDGRTFFEVDIERLPFEDGAYDFVFCSHVMEHLDNPGQAMRELSRVGKRGYLEVPTRLSDVMFNFTRLQDHHRWHSIRLGNTLCLIEWNESERRELGNEFFEALQSAYTNPFQDFFERNRDLFFTSFHWERQIDFLVIGKNGEILDSSSGIGK
ncbi:SAM-dependent methyltransferase [Rhizobium pisi]|uniref:SAM-dependent methyltransferase n=4 Tax=Rhizobium TaxID=379 RepID=A0A7W6BH31_9HYPH|nr:SAM-dependent methyltransferase [Rhizobium pisi]MBB3918899.1 SAM-dependent methyltransferase [Rhizobium fabae]TCA46700.1 class I SAM-dependent methyltransferase [Rhizobium pisi]